MEERAPYSFPCDIYELQSEIGEIFMAEEECPGVYYVSSLDPESGLPREQYIIDREAPSITGTAKQYGHPLECHPALLQVFFEKDGGGDKVISYEILVYKKQHDIPIPEDEDLLATAVYGMEDYPEYFGRYPAPIMTPHGKMVRYQELMNGILLLETETAEHLIAICYPIWAGDLSKYAMSYGEQTDDDRKRGIHRCFGYLFFKVDTGSIAIFELWKRFPQLNESGRIDIPKLMNALWEYHSQYVIRFNDRETRGENDEIGIFLKWMGVDDVELQGSPENMITMSLGAGTEYLKW
jgi:hypothetical protein